MQSWQSRVGRLPAIAAAAAFLLPTAALAFSDGPPDGVAGDPPTTQYCTNCHSTFPLNSGAGLLTLAGLPAEYVPETTYTLTVTQQDPTAARWGFEMTVIRDSDLTAAGDLEPVNPTLSQVSEGAGTERDYAKHTRDGTFAGQIMSGSWQIDWTAPPAGSGSAHFYLVGNGANNNGGNSGDRIYAIDLALFEEGTSSANGPLAEWVPTIDLYPNPAPGQGTVAFALPQDETIDLRIVDSSGRFVRQLARGDWAAGDYRIDWDGRDERGQSVPAGVYFTLLGTTRASHSDRLVVIR